MTRLSLFLGILPILFAIGLGQIDFYIVEIKKPIAMILMPFVFSPIIFAKKLGSSFIGALYGLIFWSLLGIGLFFILR